MTEVFTRVVFFNKKAAALLMNAAAFFDDFDEVLLSDRRKGTEIFIFCRGVLESRRLCRPIRGRL